MMRQSLNYWVAHRAAAKCQQALAEKGISLCVTVDEAKVRDSAQAIGKQYLTPWLDPKLNDFTPNNFFWLIAEREGLPLIVGGGRLDVVGGNAADHMLRAFTRGYGAGAVLEVSPEVSVRLSGRLCYLGDLYSKSGEGLSGVQRRYFLGVANYIASQHFQADCTYSFMRMRDVTRGSADSNGLDRRVHNPLVWGSAPQGRDQSEIIVYREARDDYGYFEGLRRELAQRAPESKGARGGLQQEGQA